MEVPVAGSQSDLFVQLANAMPHLVWMAAPDGEVTFYNDRVAAFQGAYQTPDGHWRWESILHPDDLEPTQAAWQSAVEGGHTYEKEHRVCMKDGSYRWHLSRGIPQKDSEGRITAWFGTATDIHEVITVREEQARTMAFLESLLQHAPVGFAFIDRGHRYLRVNETLAAINGLPAEAHTGKQIEEVLGDGAGPIVQVVDMVAQTGLPVLNMEFHLPHPDQPEVSRHWVLGFYPVFGKEKVDFIGAILWEVTDRVRALEAMRESESRFRSLAETLPQLVWVTDAAGNPEYYSRLWLSYFGTDDAAVWEKAIHPADRAASEKQYAAALAAGTSFRAEVRLRNRQGEYRWHASVAEPVKDSAGKVVKWVGALTDIHDQKTLSERLERLVVERTEELQRSNEDLQQFAHVASHDLKEPVRKIRTFAHILNADADVMSERGRMSLERIHKAADRITDMIEGVLSYATFSANKEGQQQVDLNAVIQDVITDLELVIREKEAVIGPADLPVIEGAPVLIHQLFYNLINNSLKFSRPGVPPVIRISSPARQRSLVRILVTDNGIGFEPAYSEQIFRTFTRLNPKDRFEGTGLGLALCKRIVERHHGAIRAEGRPGQGATFIIDLPAIQAQR